jgi:hypothetical protein
MSRTVRATRDRAEGERPGEEGGEEELIKEQSAVRGSGIVNLLTRSGGS